MEYETKSYHHGSENATLRLSRFVARPANGGRNIPVSMVAPRDSVRNLRDTAAPAASPEAPASFGSPIEFRACESSVILSAFNPWILTT
jgi:hypothetical protein